MEIHPKFKVILYREAQEFLATLDEKTRNKLTHVRFELCQASSACKHPLLSAVLSRPAKRNIGACYT